jgi:hypothetical protein
VAQTSLNRVKGEFFLLNGVTDVSNEKIESKKNGIHSS